MYKSRIYSKSNKVNQCFDQKIIYSLAFVPMAGSPNSLIIFAANTGSLNFGGPLKSVGRVNAGGDPVSACGRANTVKANNEYNMQS